MNDTSENVSNSLYSLYNDMIRQREAKKEIKKQQKEESLSNNQDDQIDDRPLTRKEKSERAMNAWKDVISSITGDDLDYVPPKKKKNKYKKWIGEDDTGNSMLVDKPKRKKKVNYNKEFEYELNMLKNIVSAQNKFADDLEKRFRNMAGPNTKDSAPLNKTAVDLASSVTASRNGALSVIKEITGVKKTIAELTMKDKKLEQDGHGSSVTNMQDLDLLGSSIASRLEPAPIKKPSVSIYNDDTPSEIDNNVYDEIDNSVDIIDDIEISPFAKFDRVPTKTIVEYTPSESKYRFKTINNTTGEEIVDYPNPTFKITNFDEKNKVARDVFDTEYPLEYVM